MTKSDEANATFQGWMDQIVNRQKPAEPPKPEIEATLSGTVENAREIVQRACEQMREEAGFLRARADALESSAAHLEFGHDLVLSLYKPGGEEQPLDVNEARKKAEAEGDRKAKEREAVEAPADGEWTCPDHGQVIEKTSTRTGRTYRACPVDGCGEIERRR